MINYKIENVKLFIGPVSLNIIDTIIDYCNNTGNIIGLIPSRRQIDYKSNYVGLNTSEFVNYVKRCSDNIIIERDHSGIGQGEIFDSGFVSQHMDAVNNFDIIHIDPWKVYKKYEDGLYETIRNIKYVNSVNDECLFEIGTEEAIRRFEIDEFDKFIKDIKYNLGDLFYKVKYAVIQSGTKIKETKNVGNFDLDRLNKMVEICNHYGLLSKEHNGDYLKIEDIKKRFNNGLSAINIAPEFGVFETDIILENIDLGKKEKLFKICYDSGKWKNWVNGNFDPFENKNELIRICGHYQFNNKKFKDMNINIDNIIRKSIYQKLENMFNI